jgi:O-antigen/teichoic acid export membrane protein
MPDNSVEPANQQEDNLATGAKGGAIAFLLKIISTGLAFINQVILARILGAEGIGEVLLAISVVKVFGLLGKFGMEEAMMRVVPSHMEKDDDARLRGAISFALRFCLVVSIILAVAVWSSSKLLAINMFHSEGLARLLPFAAAAIPISVLCEVIGGILKGFKETLRALLPQFVISLLFRIMIFLYLSVNVSDPLYAIYAYIAGEILALILAFIFLRRKSKAIKTVPSRVESRKIINIAYTMIFTGFSVYLFTQADLWIVGMLASTEEVGIYGVTAKLVTLIAFPIGALSAIIPPMISSIHTSGDLDELRKVVRGSARWTLSIAMPIVLVLILEGDFILKYVFGDKFVYGYTALLILVAGQVINTGSGLVGFFLQMTGGHKVYMKITIFFSIANVILNFLLVPRFGINGAAFSTAFCLAMINIMSVWVVYNRSSVLTLARGIGFDGIFCSAVAGLYFFCRYNSFEAGYHILLIISLTVYVGKSLLKNDIPWRLILTKYRAG